MNATTGSDLLRGSSNNTAREIPSVGRFRTLKSKELMLQALSDLLQSSNITGRHISGFCPFNTLTLHNTFHNMLRTFSIYLPPKLLTLITSNTLLTNPYTSHLIHGRGLAIHSPNS